MYRQRFVLMCCAVMFLTGWFAVAQPAAAKQPTDGFLYGTVTTRSGTAYTGLLRWGTEETFWDDLFHSSKEELPFAEYGEEAEEREGSRERWWQVFGKRMAVTWRDGGSRLFIARFGDIAQIEVVGKEDAELLMKSGTTVLVSGYANDVGATITVLDESVGDIEVPWKKIDTIEFKPTPKGVEPLGYRLRGAVTTDAGAFEGFIQWDSQECLSTDKLDGDSEDGRLSIAMGKIRSIERRSKHSSKVILKDGRELILDGTNDVDDSIRGIHVEDARFGRVEVPWSSFEEVVFEDAGGSGRGYDDFAKPAALRGKVTDDSGSEHVGSIVFDLDETESWEMLNGEHFDIEYSIPFDLIASIVRRGHSASVITLRNGEELRLEDGQDVSERNDGVVILGAEKSAKNYIEWNDVRRIDLDW